MYQLQGYMAASICKYGLLTIKVITTFAEHIGCAILQVRSAELHGDQQTKGSSCMPGKQKQQCHTPMLCVHWQCLRGASQKITTFLTKMQWQIAFGVIAKK